MKAEELIKALKELGRPEIRDKKARFGIKASNNLGITIPELRQMAKLAGKNHERAALLWESGIHEARLLAVFTEIPNLITEAQMETWVKDFDSWDICDQACGLFDQTPFAIAKALEWCERTPEYEKRAGFAMIACIAVHHKKAPDQTFEPFLLKILQHADDERNFVRKAVNWALRQIGKRNLALRLRCIEICETLLLRKDKTSRWIAGDALRELKNEKNLARLEKRFGNL